MDHFNFYDSCAKHNVSILILRVNMVCLNSKVDKSIETQWVKVLKDFLLSSVVLC